MKLIDTHVHVGPFFDRHYSPTFVSQLMSSIGVNRYAVSSTFICEENYNAVVSEIGEIIRLDDDKVLPVLWITPNMIDNNIYLLNENIKWRCLKIHPTLHPNCWDLRGKYFRKVLDLSRELKLPILIHTGDNIECNPNAFVDSIACNSDIKFILAHGRPFGQAMSVIKKYSNVLLDSAFMPVRQMIECVNEGYSECLLWGTDMCIPEYYYPQVNLKNYYIEKLKSFKEQVDVHSFEKVTYYNAESLWG